jgi:hypothetical protein
MSANLNRSPSVVSRAGSLYHDVKKVADGKDKKKKSVDKQEFKDLYTANPNNPNLATHLSQAEKQKAEKKGRWFFGRLK